MLGIIIAVLIALGILKPEPIKILNEVKEWFVFYLIHLALYIVENWKWIVAFLVWIALWVYLILTTENSRP